MDEDIQLNIVTTHSNFHDRHSGKTFTESKQRKTDFKSIKKGSISTHVQNAKKSNQSNTGTEKNVNEQPSGTSKDRPKFSSLFRNNPEIPKVESGNVNSVTEAVFSSHLFSNLDIHQHLASCLENSMKITKMTAIQKHSIPHILQGKDVLVKSQTGSGKTLCYAIPIVQHLQSATPKVQRSDGPFALVISPTRELTLQSYETFQKLLKSFVWIVSGCIMGGEKKSKEKARIRKGINIVLGTPGRLLDHLHNTSCLDLSNLKYLVIDEADRLLDMGFEKEVSQIVTIIGERSKRKRQNVLLSATLSAGVERLAGMSLNSPVKVDNAENTHKVATDEKDQEEIFTTPQSLKHHYVIVPSKLRLVTLAAFILWKSKYSSKGKKMVIFFSTQNDVEFHSKLLQDILSKALDDLHLYCLHGDMNQENRTKTFHTFIKTDRGVLLCTDVAARGLNLENVRWIVQYNSPGKATDYIHRVGRTARIGSQGHGLLFLKPSEIEYLKVLQKYQISFSEMKMEDILKVLTIDAVKWKTGKQPTPTSPHECATAVQVAIESTIQENKELKNLAKKAYQSFIRAYATYPSSMKHIFHVKQLHLGHVAKSFGLQDAPKQMGPSVGHSKRHFHEKNYDKEERPAKKPKLHLISEFSSGFDDSPKISKGKRKQKNVKGKTKN